MADEAHERISIAASPDLCWSVATDFERYPEWAKDVKHAAVLERDDEGRGRRVEFRVAGLGRSIHYVLQYDYAEAPAAFSWNLVEGDVLRQLDGRYGFKADGPGTLVTYDLLVDVAIPLPGMIKRRAAGMIVGTALKELKKEVEPMSTSLHDSEPVLDEPETIATQTNAPGAVEPELQVLTGAVGEPEAGPGLPPQGAIESLVGALLEAGPEVAEHVVRAAQELLLAAQCVVDAAGKAVREQQDVRRDDTDTDGDSESSAGATLRHLEPRGVIQRIIGPTIGVDLGGTNLRVATVAPTGEVLDEAHEPTGGDFTELVAAIARHAGEFAASSGASAIGVGVAALIDGDGTAHYAPNLPMLRQAPLRAALVDATGLPVVVDNDANVAAWGEVCHGAARGARHTLVITLGTGVGGGIVIDGRIYRGAHGFAAEVGHWQFDPNGLQCACGEQGHWEAAASGTALGHLARARSREGRAPNVLERAGGDVDRVTGFHVGDSARAAEADGLEILGEYARRVALGFVGLANILDPEVIVVSGGLASLGDLLLEPLRAAFDHHLEGASFRPAVPVVLAELGAQAGVVGAAALARELIA